MSGYLLDTHVVVWGMTRRSRLSRRTLELLDHADIAISALSVWELVQKRDAGRLDLPVQGSLLAALRATGSTLLALTAEHAEAGLALGALHGDPIDRMLVGTALVEQRILVTRDAQLLERAAPILGPLLMEA